MKFEKKIVFQSKKIFDKNNVKYDYLKLYPFFHG